MAPLPWSLGIGHLLVIGAWSLEFSRPECKADAEVAEDHRQLQGEKRAVGDVKVGPQLAQDLVRAVDVFAADEPLVGLLVALLEDALRADFAGHRVGQAALAGDDDAQGAVLLV